MGWTWSPLLIEKLEGADFVVNGGCEGEGLELAALIGGSSTWWLLVHLVRQALSHATTTGLH